MLCIVTDCVGITGISNFVVRDGIEGRNVTKQQRQSLLFDQFDHISSHLAAGGCAPRTGL